MSYVNIYLFCGVGFVITSTIFIPIYKNIDYLKCKLYQKKSEQIVFDFFTNEKKINPDISLDELILKFENSNISNLNEFAKSKDRDAESYRNVYKKFI